MQAENRYKNGTLEGNMRFGVPSRRLGIGMVLAAALVVVVSIGKTSNQNLHATIDNSCGTCAQCCSAGVSGYDSSSPTCECECEARRRAEKYGCGNGVNDGWEQCGEPGIDLCNRPNLSCNTNTCLCEGIALKCNNGAVDGKGTINGEQCDPTVNVNNDCDPITCLPKTNAMFAIRAASCLQECSYPNVDALTVQCDDNNPWSRDDCYLCQTSYCGDGIRNQCNLLYIDIGIPYWICNTEHCDLGPDNSDEPNAACRTNCMLPSCGDGIVDDQLGELCDDGNTIDNDNCTNECTVSTCGDGIEQANAEECDDGNDDNHDRCLNTCVEAQCGDGVTNMSYPYSTRVEECDDGNTTSGDGCNMYCENEWCGDGIQDADGPDNIVGTDDDEECDVIEYERNEVHNMYCTYECKLRRCGDGIRETYMNASGIWIYEQCDEGADNSDEPDATCRTDCTEQRCGDGIKDSTEACDGGEVSEGSEGVSDPENCGTNEVCSGGCDCFEPYYPQCGDGYIDTSTDPPEECDDGNTISGDGCDSFCQEETGSCTPITCTPPYPECVFINQTYDTDGCLTDCGDVLCPSASSISTYSTSSVSSYPTHKECVGFYNCAAVPGIGSDLCQFNSQCINVSSSFSSTGVASSAQTSSAQTSSAQTSSMVSTPGASSSSSSSSSSPSSSSSNHVCPTIICTEPTGCTYISPIYDYNGCLIYCGTLSCASSSSSTSTPLATPSCGDGILNQASEECEVNHTAACATDTHCNLWTCKCDADAVTRCGDGILNQADEECEAGISCAAANQVCNPADCTCAHPAANTCGDGVLDPGEECETGVACANSNDICDTQYCNCFEDRRTSPSISSAPAPTPSAPGVSSAGFRSALSVPSSAHCGDGVVNQASEECDNGDGNSNTLPNACRTNCTNPRCGDFVVDKALGEQCDLGSGNENSRDKCRLSCRLPRCGDSILDSIEECDDGNVSNNDGCSATCERETFVSSLLCGNTVLNAGEECDDGNANDGDGCSAMCQLEYAALKAAEEVSPLCGNGIIDANEECDEGSLNRYASDFCRPNCRLARCGDAIIDTAELCDDGNNISGDGCDRYCRTEDTAVLAAETNASTTAAPTVSPSSDIVFPTLPTDTSLPTQLPLATLQPLITQRAPEGDTGPAAVAIIASGMGAGLAWVRRKRRH